MSQITQIMLQEYRSVGSEWGCKFEPLKSKWWRWLNPRLEKLWNRLSRPAVNVSVRAVTVQHESIIKAITEGGHNIGRFWGLKAAKVIIGPSQAYDLETEALDKYGPSSLFSFQVPLHMANGGERQVLGLQIVVVPWFDGVLVMPNDEATPMHVVPQRQKAY